MTVRVTNRKRKRNWQQIEVRILLAMAWGITLYIGYLFLEPFTPPTQLAHPWPVLNENKEVCRGETLDYRVHFIKHSDVRVTTGKHIECADGNLVTITSPPSSSHLPLGEHNLNGSQVIPDKISDGACVLVNVVTYHVNPLKETDEYRRETEEFYVKPRELCNT